MPLFLQMKIPVNLPTPSVYHLCTPPPPKKKKKLDVYLGVTWGRAFSSAASLFRKGWGIAAGSDPDQTHLQK